MISTNLTQVSLKRLESAELDAAIEAFKSQGGEIQSLGSYGIKPKDVTWRNDGFYLPNSSQNTMAENKELAMLERIKELIAKGAGATSIAKSLGTNGKNILNRMRDKYDLKVGPVYVPGEIVTSTNAALDLKRLRHREELAKRIRPMIAAGTSLTQMSAITGSCKRTLKRVIAEFKLGEGK